VSIGPKRWELTAAMSTRKETLARSMEHGARSSTASMREIATAGSAGVLVVVGGIPISVHAQVPLDDGLAAVPRVGVGRLEIDRHGLLSSEPEQRTAG